MPTQSIVEEIYTHEYLWRSGTAIVDRIEAKADDAHHLALPALLVTYLAYEAFINFAGHVLLPELWSREKENFKGKPLEYKIERIASKLPSFEWRKGERPYQSVRQLSEFRDLVAHGKVQVNEYLAEPQNDGTHFAFRHAWDVYLARDQLLRFREDTKAFCDALLASMRQASEHPHLVFAAFEGSLASGASETQCRPKHKN